MNFGQTIVLVRHPSSRVRAFTLLELLVVMGILAILAALLVPAVGSMQNSLNLIKSGAVLKDTLQLARQLAIAKNVPVTVSLCRMDDGAGGQAFNTLLLTTPDAANKPLLIGRPVVLPTGFGIADAPGWSTLIEGLPETAITTGRFTNVPCRQFRFHASGDTDLASAANWFATVFSAIKSSEPGDNFITVQIDPRTGRILTYQP